MLCIKMTAFYFLERGKCRKLMGYFNFLFYAFVDGFIELGRTPIWFLTGWLVFQPNFPLTAAARDSLSAACTPEKSFDHSRATIKEQGMVSSHRSWLTWPAPLEIEQRSVPEASLRLATSFFPSLFFCFLTFFYYRSCNTKATMQNWGKQTRFQSTKSLPSARNTESQNFITKLTRVSRSLQFWRAGRSTQTAGVGCHDAILGNLTRPVHG